MKSLLWKLLPGAVALFALQLGINHFAHADTPAAPAPRIEAPAAYQPRPAAPDPVRLEAAAPMGQLVCGVCGNYLQAPRPVMLAMPYGQPYQGRNDYAEAPAARRLAYIDEDGVAVYVAGDYSYAPPPLDPFPFASQGRMPARYISPYSPNAPRPVIVPVGQHFHRRG